MARKKNNNKNKNKINKKATLTWADGWALVVRIEQVNLRLIKLSRVIHKLIDKIGKIDGVQGAAAVCFNRCVCGQRKKIG
jgi:hypothetical protein